MVPAVSKLAAMNTQQLIERVRGILTDRYPDYKRKAPGDRVLLAFSVLATDLRVRESGGNNRGELVEAIIGSTGLPTTGGYSWCAATVEFCRTVAEVAPGPKDPVNARVSAWVEWASSNNRLLKVPARGRLATFLRTDGTGHIGIVAAVRPDGSLRTYEGNTSSGDQGSQSNGDGLYQRIRPAGFFTRFITLD